MTGHLTARAVVAVVALYVLVSMAAAFARFPGHDMGAVVYRENTAAAAPIDETGELRTEDIVP